MKFEAPQRRSRDRSHAGPSACHRHLGRHRLPSHPHRPHLDPETDPADALLLRLGPLAASSEPAALLALVAAALGSPR